MFISPKLIALFKINFLHRMLTVAPTEPSLYMQELTRYLSANMSSVLLGLPTEIKELIYFDALSHAATMILVSCLYLPAILQFFFRSC